VPRLHADELPIDLGLVRRLVDRARPEHVRLELRRATSSGSSNVMFRLGRDLAVRLPRQPGGGASILKEATWLPLVARHLSVDVPRVVHLGEPDLDYPERWAITTWLPGTRPRPRRPGSGNAGTGSDRLANDLARFLTELRGMEAPEAADETLRWYRGLSVAELDGDFREAVTECRALGVALDLDRAQRVWDEAVAASCAAEAPDGWYHGDLLAENLLLDDTGGLGAVLDFGGMAVGNQAVDLVVAWDVLDARGRRRLRHELDVDDATWAVARGWVLFLALITPPYYGATMPARCADRLAMARAALDGL